MSPRRQWKGLGLVLIVAVMLLTCTSAYGRTNLDAPLILGILPRSSATDTITSFTPLAHYLGRRLGRPVEIETTPDMDSFWRAIKAKRYDIVNLNQLHYIRSHVRYGYDAIAKNEEFGKSTISSVLVVRRDSHIRSLADLKGKRIVFGGGKTAMMGYVVVKAMLRRAGLRRTDYRGVLAPNPLNALIAVYHHQADAGGIGNVLMSMPWIDGRVDLHNIRILAKSRSIPQLPWAVRDDMPRALRQEIQTTLVNMKQNAAGRAALHAARLTGLVPATDAEYNTLRGFVRDAARK